MPETEYAQMPLHDLLVDIVARFRSDNSGEVATYIPELGLANPDWFGVCLVTNDGAVYEAGDSRQGGRAAVPGKIRHQQPVALDQERNELGPVRRSAAEAVDEDERRPLPAQEVPHAYALDLGETLLQTGQFCVRHDGRLSFGPMTVLGVSAR